MNIEEAIAHAREVAEGCPAEDRQCAYQHDELADWLEELKAYRETRLTPKEIKEVQEAMAPIPFGRFHDIMQAEREERILVLPFKPGTEYFGHCHVKNANPISVGRFYPPYVPTLGVNAWLTREEAEAALKKQEG